MSGYYNSGGLIWEGLDVLIRNGLVEILIFALIFAIVFGVLSHVKLFGEANDNGKKYNIVIALVLAALSVLPHHVAPGSQYDIVPILERSLPQTMLVLVVILCVLILLGMFGFSMGDFDSKYGWLKTVIAGVLLVIVAWIFIAASPWGWNLPSWIDRDFVAVIIAIAIFGLVVFGVTSSKDTTTP